MNVSWIIALIFLSQIFVGCTPADVSLNSEFGFSLGDLEKSPSDTDKAPPFVVTPTTVPPYINIQNQSAVIISGECSGLEKMILKVNGTETGSIVNCVNASWSTSVDTLGKTDGTVNFEFFENSSLTSVAKISLEKDTQAPVAALSSNISSLNNMTLVTVSVSAILGYTHYSYKAGTSGGTDCTNPADYSTYQTVATSKVADVSIIADGLLKLCLIAKDAFGNEQSYANATTVTWTKDTVGPTLSFKTATHAAYINNADKSGFNFEVNCSEHDLAVRITGKDINNLETSQTAPCSSGSAAVILNLSSLAEGNVVFVARQVDAANNASETQVRTILKDTVGPTFTSSSVNDGGYISSLTSSPNISWPTASDSVGASGLQKYSLSIGTSAGATNEAFINNIGSNTTSYTYTTGVSLTEGTRYYTRIKAYDNAGNFNHIDGNGWVPDVTGPTVTSVNDGVFSGIGQSPVTTWSTGNDGGGSGVATYHFAVGTTAGGSDIQSWISTGNVTSFQVTSAGITLGGTYYVSIRAVDAVGNVGPVAQGDGFIAKNTITSVVSNNGAFAAKLTNGKVIVWGDSSYGGDYASIPSALKSGGLTVTSLHSSYSAFAAIMSDGSVITWGDPTRGGNSSLVSSELNGTINVVSIVATLSAFAALRDDGSVVAWGSSSYGGVLGTSAPDLDGTVNVISIKANNHAFAAIRDDGSVITWGNPTNGGDSSTVALDINGNIPTVALYSTNTSFIARRSNGSLVTWGYISSDVPFSGVAAQVNGTIPVTNVVTNASSVAALRQNGSVITWGSTGYGGNSSSVASFIDGSTAVTTIYSNNYSFVAVRANGSAIPWGSSTDGGAAGAKASFLTGTPAVNTIYRTTNAYAAVRADQSVITWGNSAYGADSTSVATAINGVTTPKVISLASTGSAFAALRDNGSVIAWGTVGHGGDTGSVASYLSGTIPVVSIHSNPFAFVAIRNDGTFVTWGDNTYGGDSSSVNSL